MTTTDLTRLMYLAYEKTCDAYVKHRVFSSEDIQLESWAYQGGRTPPCQIFSISVSVNGGLRHGMVAYLTFCKPWSILKIDSIGFDEGSKNPIWKYLVLRSGKMPKNFIVLDPACDFNSVDLDCYGSLEIQGGWDRVLVKIEEFIKRMR